MATQLQACPGSCIYEWLLTAVLQAKRLCDASCRQVCHCCANEDEERKCAMRRATPTSRTVMMGVLIFLVALMISLMRGTPSVTFMAATPAKWNVFSVICVPGSPMLCAPTAPTVAPAYGGP